MGKPSSLNLLTGDRSYELQIWWEIEPRLLEVYPRRNSLEGVRSDSREEDEKRTHVAGRVSTEREERFHIFLEMQKVDLQKPLKKQRLGCNLTQCPFCIGFPKVGPTLSFEF